MCTFQYVIDNPLPEDEHEPHIEVLVFDEKRLMDKAISSLTLYDNWGFKYATLGYDRGVSRSLMSCIHDNGKGLSVLYNKICYCLFTFEEIDDGIIETPADNIVIFSLSYPWEWSCKDCKDKCNHVQCVKDRIHMITRVSDLGNLNQIVDSLDDIGDEHRSDSCSVCKSHQSYCICPSCCNDRKTDIEYIYRRNL